jgi:hypothetical protein
MGDAVTPFARAVASGCFGAGWSRPVRRGSEQAHHPRRRLVCDDAQSHRRHVDEADLDALWAGGAGRGSQAPWPPAAPLDDLTFRAGHIDAEDVGGPSPMWRVESAPQRRSRTRPRPSW